MKAELMTGEKLAAYLSRTVALRTIQSICSQAGLSSRGGYDMRKAICAVVSHFRAAAEKISTIKSEADSRRAKSEADSAELDTLKKLGETCLMSDAKLFWSEDRIAIRQTIERAPYLAQDAKKKLLGEIAKIHPAELESEA